MQNTYNFPVIFAVENKQNEEGDFPVYIAIPDLINAGFPLATSCDHTEDDVLAVASDLMKMSIKAGLKKDLEIPVASKLGEINLTKYLSNDNNISTELKSISIEWIKAEV